MSIKELLKQSIENLTNSFPYKNLILCESVPDYSDNTKKVFDELIRRGVNQKYTFMWVCKNPESVAPLKAQLSDIPNVKVIYRHTRPFKYYYRKVARYFLMCNLVLDSARPEQVYINLAHGAAFKNCAGKYFMGNTCQKAIVMSLGDYIAKYDAINISVSEEEMVPLGYPRNDDLLTTRCDTHRLFDVAFDKIIYWLPTFRQHKFGIEYSSISVPFIHDEQEAKRLNAALQEQKVLLVLKPHPQQDVSKISNLYLSNIVLIDNDFLDSHGVSNYELLGACDALLTDYSSVYYDYLLCDKPIGLGWEDFEEYNTNEGFTVDPDFIMKGGEKLYTTDDLICFTQRIASGEDILQKERRELASLIHNHLDAEATRRVTDYVESLLTQSA